MGLGTGVRSLQDIMLLAVRLKKSCGPIFANIGPFGLILFALQLLLFCDLISVIHTGNPALVVENPTVISTHVESKPNPWIYPDLPTLLLFGSLWE